MKQRTEVWTPLYTLLRQAILILLKKALRRKNRLEMEMIMNINVFEHLEEEVNEEIFCRIRRPYILRLRKDQVVCWNDTDF